MYDIKRRAKADQRITRNLLLFSYLRLFHNIRSKCECARPQCEWAWYWLSDTTYIYIATNIQARVRNKISPPNLSEGGSLRSPINVHLCMCLYVITRKFVHVFVCHYMLVCTCVCLLLHVSLCVYVLVCAHVCMLC